MFLTLVENSFKHGTSKQNSGAWISICLEQPAPDMLHFRVSNSKTDPEEPLLQGRKNGGIGLSNLKKRLDMLYQNKHKLMISDTGRSYTVDLHIKL